jgi:hypothetical protein
VQVQHMLQQVLLLLLLLLVTAVKLTWRSSRTVTARLMG